MKTGVYKHKIKILKKNTGSPRDKHKPKEMYNNNTKILTSIVTIVVYDDDQ